MKSHLINQEGVPFQFEARTKIGSYGPPWYKLCTKEHIITLAQTNEKAQGDNEDAWIDLVHPVNFGVQDSVSRFGDQLWCTTL